MAGTTAKKKTSSGTAKKSTSRSKSRTGQSTQRSSNVRKQTKNTRREPNPVFTEIGLLLTIGFVIILFLSMLGVCGPAGRYISIPVFGLFGAGGYVFPFVLVIAVFFLVANHASGSSKVKAFGTLIVNLGVSAFLHLINKNATMVIGELFAQGVDEKTGGGLLGGMLANLFMLFGRFGGILLAIILIIIGLVIVTQRSFIGLLSSGGTRVYESTKENLENYRQESVEKRNRYAENNESGVSFNTVIPHNKDNKKKNKNKNEFFEEINDNDLDQNSNQNSNDNFNMNVETGNNGKGRNNTFAKDIYNIEGTTKKNEVEIKVVEVAPLYYEDSTEYKKKHNNKVKPQDDIEAIEDLENSLINNNLSDVTEVKVNTAATKKKNEDGDAFNFVDINTGNNDHNDNNEINNNPKQENIKRPETILEKTKIKKLDPAAEDNKKTETVTDKTNNSKAFELVEDINTDNKLTEPVVDNKTTEPVMDTTPLVVEELPIEEQYEFPPIELLNKNTRKATVNERDNANTAKILKETLKSFGVNVTVTDISCGPSVTRYEIQPEQGTKVSKIVNLSDDIKLNLAAADIRIEAPIPGKAAVGIEVPNKEAGSVMLRELLEAEDFTNHSSKLAFGAGKDIAGKVIVADIAKMPHVLIAGATGSGKSVCINTIIMSILYKARPDEVKLIMIDPKVVELSVYNGIPHLLIPVVTDPSKASQALNWAVAEMDDRYKKFSELGVRDLKGYNEKIVKQPPDENGNVPSKLPQIVVIVDELADLMMVAPGEVEAAITRIAQLARACGIHLVIATQRPSVNVITGLIKANVPSRIAFSVSSGVDSRTILDMVGAEKLLGKGDMLFYPSGYQKPVRVQGAFVSDNEVSAVVEFLRERNSATHQYDKKVEEALNHNLTMADSQAFGGDRDSYFEEAGRFVIEKEKASIGLIQRFYKVGFNRAARIIDQLAEAGVIGPQLDGNKPRKITMTLEEFEAYLQSHKG